MDDAEPLDLALARHPHECGQPGPVDTPILKDFLATLGARAERTQTMWTAGASPATSRQWLRFCCPNEAPAWIRGTNVPVDGGMYSNVLCAMHGF